MKKESDKYFFCKACGGIFPGVSGDIKVDAGKTVYDCVASEECIKIIERELRNTMGGLMNFHGGVRKKPENLPVEDSTEGLDDGK